jgi:hypothetical protein
MSGQQPAANRRVVVGLCAGAAEAETMRAAAEFAQLLGFDLHCLFVEDEALLALAELPFAREIRLPAHTWSPLDVDTVEADIRRITSDTRRLMQEVIHDVGVASNFEVLRGDPAACIAGVCATGDIVVVTASARQTAPETHTVARLHAGAREAATSVLLLPSRHRVRHGPIVALLADGSDAALEMACRLAVTAKEHLVILTSEQTPRQEQAAAESRAMAMGLSRVRIDTRVIQGNRADDALHALTGLRERMIVMPRTAPAAAAASHIALARGVPVLLVAATP